MTLIQNNQASRPADPKLVNYAFYELIWAMCLVMVCLSIAIALIHHYQIPLTAV